MHRQSAHCAPNYKFYCRLLSLNIRLIRRLGSSVGGTDCSIPHRALTSSMKHNSSHRARCAMKAIDIVITCRLYDIRVILSLNSLYVFIIATLSFYYIRFSFPQYVFKVFILFPDAFIKPAIHFNFRLVHPTRSPNVVQPRYSRGAPELHCEFKPDFGRDEIKIVRMSVHAKNSLRR
jgi:hypothetical protein